MNDRRRDTSPPSQEKTEGILYLISRKFHRVILSGFVGAVEYFFLPR